jgi:predicted phage terminase large subunit-like protein
MVRQHVVFALNDKEHGSIILVMQRLHEDDLSGHLIEKGGFDVTALPARATEDERWRLSDGRTFRRKAGQALHPERESLDILAEIEASQGSRVFQSQYQQAPVPADGNLFKRPWIRRYEMLPDLTEAEMIQCWDTATGIGKANDYSVCTTWAIINKLYYLLDVHRGRWEFPDLVKQVHEMAERWRATTVLIEDASFDAALLQVLRPSCSFNLIGRKPRLEKQVRASAQSACFESGRAILPHEALAGRIREGASRLPVSKIRRPGRQHDHVPRIRAGKIRVRNSPGCPHRRSLQACVVVRTRMTRGDPEICSKPCVMQARSHGAHLGSAAPQRLGSAHSNALVQRESPVAFSEP